MVSKARWCSFLLLDTPHDEHATAIVHGSVSMSL